MYGVKKLLYLGSSCIYPRECPQPMKEEYLLTGPLEPTNEPYAVAKIAGIKLCQAYRTPVRLRLHLGDADQPLRAAGQLRPRELARAAGADPQVPRRQGSAAQRDVVIWGTGAPRREFLHVDDLADACVFLMEHYDGDIAPQRRHRRRPVDRANWPRWSATIVYPEARLVFDTSKPDGTPRKLLDVSRLHALGWRHRIELRGGIEATYAWFLDNHDHSARASLRKRE